MSQLTKRIRLYGSDCNQTAMVVRIQGIGCIMCLPHNHSSSKPSGRRRSMWKFGLATMSLKAMTPHTSARSRPSRRPSRPTAPTTSLESLLETNICSSAQIYFYPRLPLLTEFNQLCCWPQCNRRQRRHRQRWCPYSIGKHPRHAPDACQHESSQDPSCWQFGCWKLLQRPDPLRR